MTREQIKSALEADFGCGPGMVHEGYGAECKSAAHAPALYRTFGCDHVAHVAEVIAALLPEVTETVEWGAKYTNGHIASCGWLEGISEHLARTATQPPDLTKGVRIGQPQALAVVTRIRRASLTVTEWTEVAS